MCIVLVAGQLFGNGFGRDFGYNGYNALNGDFGGPSAFSSSLGVGSTNVRDPRQNRGMFELQNKNFTFFKINFQFHNQKKRKKNKLKRVGRCQKMMTKIKLKK